MARGWNSVRGDVSHRVDKHRAAMTMHLVRAGPDRGEIAVAIEGIETILLGDFLGHRLLESGDLGACRSGKSGAHRGDKGGAGEKMTAAGREKHGAILGQNSVRTATVDAANPLMSIHNPPRARKFP